MSSIIEFKRPDGKTSKGYLTEANKDAPAIVVIQEWWGMNDQIKKVAVTGFCMGGALTCLSSVHVPELNCAVIWYGYPPLDLIDANKIKIPLIGHWALHDDAFNISGVDQLEKKLKDAKVNFEFFRYDAKHAFANEEADERNLPYLKYNEEAKKLAWTRTMTFLSKNLK